MDVNLRNNMIAPHSMFWDRLWMGCYINCSYPSASLTLMLQTTQYSQIRLIKKFNLQLYRSLLRALPL
jgi:hypothetical protein